LQRLGSRRSHRQIFAEILDLCKKPRVKTHIMYRANLSYRSLQHYLMHLQKYGFLEVHHSKEKYSTTEKGLKFLQMWIELNQILTSEET
jgi:predicted transcriptional regulator